MTDGPALEPVVTYVEAPQGMLGPNSVTFEVRCFIVPAADGVVVVDTGPPGTADAIEEALGRVGAGWPDVTDVVLTHHHVDHVGDLAEVGSRAPRAVLWAGKRDVPLIHLEGDRVIRPISEGDRVRDLVVLETPGHTAGHISVVDETRSLVLVGDAVGSVSRGLSFGPAAFTADPARARASVERLATLLVERFVFSHGAEIPDPSEAIKDLLRSSG